MRRCILYSLGFGLTAMALLFAFSYPIGVFLLGDDRTVLSLRVLSPALPCIALSSAMNGYFTGGTAGPQIGGGFGIRAVREDHPYRPPVCRSFCRRDWNSPALPW